jgi:hypothetical protein
MRNAIQESVVDWYSNKSITPLAGVGSEFRSQALHSVQIEPVQPRAGGELTQQLHDDRRIAEKPVVERVVIRLGVGHDDRLAALIAGARVECPARLVDQVGV